MTNIYKVRMVLLLALMVQTSALAYLFGVTSETIFFEVLADVARKTVLLLEISTLIFLGCTLFLSEGDDFYATSYAKYMKAVWGSFWEKPLGVSVCRATWLGAFTLLGWLILILVFSAILINTYLVVFKGFAASIFWVDERGFLDNVLGTVLLCWTLVSNVIFGYFYYNLVFKYKKSNIAANIGFSFVIATIALLWIGGGMQTFGWNDILPGLYWVSVVLGALSLVVFVIYGIVKLKIFKVVTVPGSLFIQSLHGLKEGMCPIIPRKESTARSYYRDNDYDEYEE